MGRGGGGGGAKTAWQSMTVDKAGRSEGVVHLEVEDEPRCCSLSDDVHKEVGDSKQPHERIRQHVAGQ